MIQSKLYMSEAVFFLFIAVFLGAYLYGILGKENEEDENIRSRYVRYSRVFEETGVSESDKGDIEVEAMEVLEDDALEGKLKELKKKLPDFDTIDFHKKASKAFEIVCNAYIEGDTDTLKMLLSKKVFPVFKDNIDKLLSKKQKMESIMFRMVSAKFYAIRVESNEVSIALKIISEQCNVIKDSEDSIVAGSNEHIVTHREIWTFTKNLKSNNMVWLVSDIQSYNE